MTCPACGETRVAPEPVYQVTSVPATSCAPAYSREAALGVSRGDIELVCCTRCGLLFNARYEPRLVAFSDAYEARQCFSETFNRFTATLTSELVDAFALHGKRIVEIGCGQGDFLRELCARSGSHGYGIDPACPDEETPAVSFVRETFGLQHAGLAADFFCCRHTLEHVADPADFLATLREVIGDRHDTGVFFEVPETMRILEECAFWDIQYEHCSYFTKASLTRLFRACGFDVTASRLVYDAQYLALDAWPRNGGVVGDGAAAEGMAVAEVVAAAKRFRDGVTRAIGEWDALLTDDAFRRAVIWGAGAKCQGWMNAVPAAVRVRYVIDVNPFLHGRFMTGTGTEIQPPRFLKEFQPDLVVIMNRIYEQEVREALGALGVRARVVALP